MHGPAFAFGGVGGHDRFDLQCIEAGLYLFRRHVLFPEFAEQGTERLPRRIARGKVADAGAFFAEIDELKKETERVGYLVGFFRAEVGDQRTLGMEALLAA